MAVMTRPFFLVSSPFKGAIAGKGEMVQLHAAPNWGEVATRALWVAGGSGEGGVCIASTRSPSPAGRHSCCLVSLHFYVSNNSQEKKKDGCGFWKYPNRQSSSLVDMGVGDETEVGLLWVPAQLWLHGCGRENPVIGITWNWCWGGSAGFLSNDQQTKLICLLACLFLTDFLVFSLEVDLVCFFFL